jgi:uncharacterized protein YbjT (DUF2867 family)
LKNVIVVTGASGNTGQGLAERLLSAGHGVRAIARGAKKLQPLAAKGAEIKAGSLDDRAFLASVFKGAAAVYAMIPPNYTAADPRAEQQKIAESLAGAVRDSGVKKVVTLSSFGAEEPRGTGPIVGVHVLEKLFDEIPGLDVVHLRAGYFMENHFSNMGLVKSAGINGGGLKADIPLPMVATRDISAVAAEYLSKLDWKGRTIRYVLGAKDVTMSEATRILGAAIGKPDLKYVEFPEPDFKKGLMGAGLSSKMADLFLEMVRGLNTGLIKAEPRSKANTNPTTLEEFARTVYAPAFKAPGAAAVTH